MLKVSFVFISVSVSFFVRRGCAVSALNISIVGLTVRD